MSRTAQRRDRLRNVLKTEELDALLIVSVTNVSYLSGFTGDDSTLLLTPKRATIISDGRYTTQLKEECKDVDVHIRPVGQPMGAGIADVVNKLGVRRLGFESAAVSVAEYEDLRERLPAVEFRGVKQ